MDAKTQITVVGFDLYRTGESTVHWSHDCPAYRRAKWGSHWKWAVDKTRSEIEACFTREHGPLKQCRTCWPKEHLVGSKT